MDENLALKSIFVHICNRFFHAAKSYNMGESAFTSSAKEGVLQNFITLKSPKP
jgi:hypothetical protein